MGIFDSSPAFTDTFTVYRARLAFRDKLMGGIPRNPEVIEGWLRAKAGMDQQEEVRQAMLRTLLELGADVRPDMSYAELAEASKGLAGTKNTNGFKRDEHGLYIESRIVKSMLKENVNILYAGERWGRTKKGPKNLAAERVFIRPDRIHLHREEPDGLEMFITHVTGPTGPRSGLSYHEYVERAEVEFEVLVTEDAIEHAHWPRIWLQAQENGLGALRSQGFGRFDIEAWEPVKEPNKGRARPVLDLVAAGVEA